MNVKPVSYTHLDVYKRQGYIPTRKPENQESLKDASSVEPLSIPVSYTHLDVYKRQVFGVTKNYNRIKKFCLKK